MKISGKIARSAVFALTLAACAIPMHSQESKPPEKKAHENTPKRSDSAPPQQHNAPAQQRTPPVEQNASRPPRHEAAPAAQVPHTPPVDQNTSRPQRQDSQTRPRPEAPAAQTPQGQPNNSPIYRNPQSTPGGQPGRTFAGSPRWGSGRIPRTRRGGRADRLLEPSPPARAT